MRTIIYRYKPCVAPKTGGGGLLHVLANELRGRGITGDAIASGPIGTELFLTGKGDEQIAGLPELSPPKRLGMPDDIASVASFLAVPYGGWVNLQVVRVNGGFA